MVLLKADDIQFAPQNQQLIADPNLYSHDVLYDLNKSQIL